MSAQEDLEAMLRAAETLLGFGRLEEAEAIYRQVESVSPFHSAMGLATLAFQMGDFAQAKRRILRTRRDSSLKRVRSARKC